MGRVKKSRRHWHATFCSDPGDGRTPPPRNAILLPLIDNVAVFVFGTDATEDGFSDGSTAAQMFDQLRMLAHARKCLKIVQTCQVGMSEMLSNDSLQGFHQHADMAKRIPKRDAIEAGLRLRRLRFALGYGEANLPPGTPPKDREKTLERFAAKILTKANLISKYEAGAAMVPYKVVSNIRDVFEIPKAHQFIYEDRRDVLPQNIYEKFMDLIEDDDEEEPAKPRGRKRAIG